PPVLELPTDRPRPAIQSYRGATCSRLIPKDLVSQLISLSHAEGVTLFMTLLAAFQTLLARYSGQEDIVVGTPIANRNRIELERVPSYTHTSMFDMAWFAIEVPEGLLLRAEYSTDLFEADTIERALGHFHILLEAIVAQPQQRIRELPILSEMERSQLLVDFN